MLLLVEYIFSMDFWSQPEDEELNIDKSYRPVIASILRYCAGILLLSTLSSFVFSIIPLKITDPAWQLRVVSGMLNSTLNILLSGIILLASAGLVKFEATNKGLLAKYLRFIRLFSIAVIAAIPLQIYAGHNAVNRQFEPIHRTISAGPKKPVGAIES